MAHGSWLLAGVGNYLSFGDTKFIPRISADKLDLIVKASTAAAEVGTLLTVLSPVHKPLGVDQRTVLRRLRARSDVLAREALARLPSRRQRYDVFGAGNDQRGKCS